MNIAVIGCGRWGSLITWYLDTLGHSMTLYGRRGSERMARFMDTRQNDLLTLPESVRLTYDLGCVEASDTVVISIGAQGLQKLMEELRGYSVEGKTFILCMKGLEMGTGRRLSQIARENLPASCHVAVWLGPGHVQEFYHGIPNLSLIHI